jgi:hypothetical protein
MTERRQLVVLAVAVLLLVTAGLPGVVVAQEDGGDTDGTASASDPCSGLAPGAAWVCEGLFGVVEWVIAGVQSLVRGMFEAVVEFIVATPAPYADGEMALVEQPDNPPWGGLYDLYLTKTLPIGIGLWALIVLLVQVTTVFTHTAGGEYQRSRLTRRAAFGILMLIAWWPMGAFTLHLANALTTTVAPSGTQMVGTISEFFANIGGGLIAAVLLYLSAGVVAVLLVALFLARFVIIFTLMPAMPILIALWIVDEGPLKPLAEVAESIGGLFVPFVFMTLPTAAILLVGYTVQDALRRWLASLPVVGVASSPEATSAYALILFVFWVMALIAPLFVLFGRRGLFPLAYLSAGFIAGRSLSIPRGGRSGTTIGGRQSTEATASSAGAAGSAAGSTVGSTTTLPRPFEQGLPARTGASGGTRGTGGRGGSAASGSSGGVTIGETSGLGDDYSIRARPTDWIELNQQLPDDRQYKFGFSQNGEFQPLRTGPPNTNKSTILRGRIGEIADSRHFAGKSDMYLRDDEGEYYDLTQLLEKARKEAQVDREARQIALDARAVGHPSMERDES